MKTRPFKQVEHGDDTPTVEGRAGRVHIEQDVAGQVWVGGQSVTCVDGTVNL